ncbi:MAG TPA: hypothetical protein PKD85_15540, partial [Saprospiraceae bacterium]|nr:hypothetical protein [Saprospiraceae bacterium]
VGPLFEELKSIQNRYYKESLSNRDKNFVWGKLDAAFKSLKANKDQKQERGQRNSEENHIKSRLAGLADAIKRMEKSVERNYQEIDFQNKHIGQSEGKLELQLREAKMKMVETALLSKKEKLDDMLKTRVSLEAKLKSFEEKREKREAEHKVKQKIAEGIEEQKEKLVEETEKLESAAAEISASKSKSLKTIVSDIIEEVKEVAEDVVHTTKAVLEVAEERLENLTDALEEKLEKVEDKLDDKIEDLANKAETTKENLKDKIESAEDQFDAIEDKVEEVVENIIEKGKEFIEDIKEKFNNSDSENS